MHRVRIKGLKKKEKKGGRQRDKVGRDKIKRWKTGRGGGQRVAERGIMRMYEMREKG